MHTSNIELQFRDHCNIVSDASVKLAPAISNAVTQIVKIFNSGNKLLIVGNGGSAADAQHFAAEIVSRFKMERPGLPALALSTDTSIITAIGNDYGFECVFSRQIEALAVTGDCVIGISTSGNSLNVLKALERARGQGCFTIGLLGNDGGSIKSQCDIPLVIPSKDTPRVQEAHIIIIHVICDLIEQSLFAGTK